MMMETKRLLLRPFTESDYDDLFEFLSQLEDDEFEGYPSITYEKGKKHLEERLNNDDYFAIELKQTGKVIGNIYCGKREFNSSEVGYIVNKNHQRQGYALEALKAIIGFEFLQGTHRIYAQCDPLNECSWKLLEKAGLNREACLKKNVWFIKSEDGSPKWKDTYVYAVLNPNE